MVGSVGYLVKEAVWSFAILCFFIAAGFGPILLFKNLIRYHLLASPLAGLLLVNTATLGVYFIFQVSYGTAALCAAGLCLIASVVLWVVDGQSLSVKDIVVSVAVLGIVTVCFAGLSNTAAIKNGEPSIMYLDGTDHPAYAQVADWMRDHIQGLVPAIDGPRADPAHPYESFPNIILNSEPRNGVIGFLALIGLIRQLPSIFAYDPASGTYLSSAVVGVAAVFARSWFAFTVLALGLSFSSWYDFSHLSYLGKATAYPATLFTLGLFLISRKMSDLRVVLIILILCAASALLLSGLWTGVIFASLGGSAILMASFFEKSIDRNQTLKLAMCVFVSLLAGGFFVHPVNSYRLGHVDAYPAAYVASRSLDMEGWGATTGFQDMTLFAMIAASMLAAICAAWIAVLHRSANALALLITPAVIYVILLIFTVRTELLQMTGLLYPAMLCGLGLVVSELQDVRRWGLLLITVGCLIITAALRAPHAYRQARRYTSPEAITRSYPKSEIDHIANVIGPQQTSLVDLGGKDSLLMLVELGRRGLALQWTAHTWELVVGDWRGWPLPRYETPADLRITSDRKDIAQAIYSGPHFAVVPNQKPSSP
jgi:hypothetical protein